MYIAADISASAVLHDNAKYDHHISDNINSDQQCYMIMTIMIDHISVNINSGHLPSSPRTPATALATPSTAMENAFYVQML